MFVSLILLSNFGLAWAKSQAPDAIGHALSILDVMEQQGLQPDVQTYSSVIDAIAQSGHDPEQAEDILDHMMESGVRPDIVTYSAVINGKQIHFGVQNIICFAIAQENILLSAWAKSGRSDSIKRTCSMVNTMKRQGLQPDVQTYTSILDLIARSGTSLKHAQVIIQLYHLMVKEGGAAQPHIGTLNTILNALEAAGHREMALNTYKHALQRGIIDPWKHENTTDGKITRVMVRWLMYTVLF